MSMSEKTNPKDVTESFNNFLETYDRFRQDNNLSGTLDNAFEATTSMLDKLGRIARQVKHYERNDPKPDWPEGVTIEMAGLIVYMIILMNKYNISMEDGMKAELEKAVDQHSKW